MVGEQMGLKELRHRKGMTQVKLSEVSGVPRPNISDIERGDRPPEQIWLGTAVKLADALGVNPKELLD